MKDRKKWEYHVIHLNLDKNSDKIRKCNYSINEKNLSYSS